MANEMIGSAEAAEILDIDRSTLTRWANANQIAIAHRGTGKTGELFFYRADVLKLAPSTTSTPDALTPGPGVEVP
jgi:predicted site-specific integrase-resolvase